MPVTEPPLGKRAAPAETPRARLPPKARSGRLVVFVIFGCSALAAVAAVVARKLSAPYRNAELQRVIATRAEAISSTRPRTRVEIHTVPTAATLMVDGVRVTNPFVRTGAGDTTAHEVKADMSGHQPVRQVVTFERDQVIVLTLRPSDSNPPP